ncbi:unnamed protein product [Rhodiola kirilowii]
MAFCAKNITRQFWPADPHLWPSRARESSRPRPRPCPSSARAASEAEGPSRSAHLPKTPAEPSSA